MANDRAYRVVPDGGPWGEYSAVLIHGLASAFQRGISGELLIERTGPFVPPMTFPSGLGPAVTAALKEEIERSGLAGAVFLPAVKKHIAFSRWHEWDIEAPEPRRRPRSGRPEDYIVARTHSRETSEAIGELWELQVDASAGRPDFFRRPASPGLFISQRAREALEPLTGRWVRYEPEPDA